MSGSSLRVLLALATLVAFAGKTTSAHRKLETGTKLEWPALRFHFTIKQESVKVYDQSSFDMYANPIVLDDNKDVLYDVYATFTQPKALHNYTLVDGIAYSELTPFTTGSSSGTPTPQVVCLDTESGKLPAINSIVAAVNEATNSSGNGTVASTCATGTSYETAINGGDYEVCVSGTTGFTMQGSLMDISVNYLDSHIDIRPPTMDRAAASKCSNLGLSSSVSPIGHALLTGEPMPTGTKTT
ncbi:hypothetical protein PHYPSEUDO_014385 [Phytophthora pseudosyringae]|uniref:Uncharacterized protein n=1 Tax=Phytophthora pseudosyringae TaxID=221518 RepID=A0A8T1W203_9STRA|nr:hypothetical protein PHYPSEUDO_014385 [Phytophthora pseudosyringae]